MVKKLLPLLLLLALLAGCAPRQAGLARTLALSGHDQAAAVALLDAQLGDLADYLTEEEYARALRLMESLWPIRAQRLEQERYRKSAEEDRLLQKLNRLYDDYTGKYLAGGDENTFGYENPAEESLAEYDLLPDGALSESGEINGEESGEYHDLWNQITSILPDGALDDFTQFTVFTDGPGETMAYVDMADSSGDKWLLAVDSADSGDGAYFTETILHEYCHYLTLNDEQVRYTWTQTLDTYNEEGMAADPGSYLDEFYQKFWSNYLDDRLANLDSYYFFYRHYDDFVNDYASTSPTEDIAESFTFFVLWDKESGDAVWQQKLSFFYDYPELVDFRTEVRKNLGL